LKGNEQNRYTKKLSQTHPEFGRDNWGKIPKYIGFALRKKKRIKHIWS